MESQIYWNEIGAQKEFEDPLYLDKLDPFLGMNSTIVEYGCGYGRLLHQLKAAGYEQVMGFDFAPKMVERGRNLYPDLGRVIN